MPALPNWLQILLFSLAFLFLIRILPRDLDERPLLHPRTADAPPALDDLPSLVHQPTQPLPTLVPIPSLPPPLARTWTPTLDTYLKLIAFSLTEQGGMLAVPVCHLEGIRYWFAETYGRAILPDETRSRSNPEMIWLNIIGVRPRS